MATDPTRVMLVGGDLSTWVALSAGLTEGKSHIFVPNSLNVEALTAAKREIDVLVVLTSVMDPDPCAPLRVIREAGLHERTLLIADGDDQRTAAEALELGVAGYLSKEAPPSDIAAALRRIGEGGVVFDRVAAAVLHNRGVESSPDGFMGAARALAAALELKDTYTGGHAERVTSLAIKLARDAGLEDTKPSEALEAGFLLHDVGKIGIPESILNKPGSLTDTERRVLNTHPILGERIVAPLGFPLVVRQVIRHHHERWDGTGYPDGLRGHEIPGPARVFAIADVIDAMTSIRPYRKPVSFEEALGEVAAQAGTQFDPGLTEIARETFLGARSETPSIIDL